MIQNNTVFMTKRRLNGILKTGEIPSLFAIDRKISSVKKFGAILNRTKSYDLTIFHGPSHRRTGITVKGYSNRYHATSSKRWSSEHFAT